MHNKDKVFNHVRLWTFDKGYAPESLRLKFSMFIDSNVRYTNKDPVFDRLKIKSYVS